jgi:segregation and condensation protein B
MNGGSAMPGLITEREKILEAMLFASPESVTLEKLSESLGCDIPLTRNLLKRMGETYAKEASGIQLSEVDGAYRLCTNPAYYPAVQRLLQKKLRSAFSQSTLETLAIIAFKQPITRGAIEEIRGINSDYSVNKLVECGFVTEMGRLDAPGRPILFGTSEEFLLYYGLTNIKELLGSLSPIDMEDELNDNGSL